MSETVFQIQDDFALYCETCNYRAQQAGDETDVEEIAAQRGDICEGCDGMWSGKYWE